MPSLVDHANAPYTALHTYKTLGAHSAARSRRNHSNTTDPLSTYRPPRESSIASESRAISGKMSGVRVEAPTESQGESLQLATAHFDGKLPVASRQMCSRRDVSADRADLQKAVCIAARWDMT